MTDRITRADVEQLLHELSGFSADSATIAERMVIIDIYAASLSETISESQLHLLYQQAELLLDSKGMYATLRNDLSDLSERITQLAATTLEATTPPWMPPRVELTEADREAVRAAMPAWERELLETGIAKPDAPEKQSRVRNGGTEVWCHGHAAWEPASDFYKNSKSRTGYESKCKTAARPNRVRAA